ncbi:unnamed protein product, partial [Rotaria magnacalcarata]
LDHETIEGQDGRPGKYLELRPSADIAVRQRDERVIIMEDQHCENRLNSSFMGKIPRPPSGCPAPRPAPRISRRRHQSYNPRLVGDLEKEPKQLLQPITGYEHYPLVSLEEACEPLVSFIEDIERYAWIAKQNSRSYSLITSYY